MLNSAKNHPERPELRRLGSVHRLKKLTNGEKEDIFAIVILVMHFLGIGDVSPVLSVHRSLKTYMYIHESCNANCLCT